MRRRKLTIKSRPGPIGTGELHLRPDRRFVERIVEEFSRHSVP